jgi:hypothetical protein
MYKLGLTSNDYQRQNSRPSAIQSCPARSFALKNWDPRDACKIEFGRQRADGREQTEGSRGQRARSQDAPPQHRGGEE